MANILEEGKRGRALPRLTNGGVHTSQQYAIRDTSLEERTMPPLLYCVHVANRIEGKEYVAQFTEDEMIAITSEWLTCMNRRRIDAAIEARRKAERASCPSKISPAS